MKPVEIGNRLFLFWLPVVYLLYFSDFSLLILFVGMWLLVPPVSLSLIAKRAGRDAPNGVKRLGVWFSTFMRYVMFLED